MQLRVLPTYCAMRFELSRAGSQRGSLALLKTGGLKKNENGRK
jgi:hypothetical protein